MNWKYIRSRTVIPLLKLIIGVTLKLGWTPVIYHHNITKNRFYMKSRLKGRWYSPVWWVITLINMLYMSLFTTGPKSWWLHTRTDITHGNRDMRYSGKFQRKLTEKQKLRKMRWVAYGIH